MPPFMLLLRAFEPLRALPFAREFPRPVGIFELLRIDVAYPRGLICKANAAIAIDSLDEQSTWV